MRFKDRGQITNNLTIALEEIESNQKLMDIFNVELLDGNLYSHSIGVAQIAIQLMVNLNYNQRDIIETAIGAILHDVGKLYIPYEILYKPGKLTDEEFEIVKKHPEQGYSVLKDKGLSKQSLDVVRYHHEKSDGSGYPYGLKNIPVSVQLVTIADIFSAMTESRCYHLPLSTVKTLRYMDNLDILDSTGVDALFDSILD